MKRAACDACGYVHAPDATYAVGRFGHGPLAFRARFEGSPVRESRAAAESDLCEWRASPPGGVTSRTSQRMRSTYLPLITERLSRPMEVVLL